MSHINNGMTLPATVHTSDIKNSLMYFCKTNKVFYKDLDFFVVKTITKVVDKTLAQNEATILELEGAIAIDERYMNSASYDVKQVHTISIYAKEEDGSGFKLTLDADADFCSVNVILHKGSVVVKNRFLERMLYSEISKILAINNIILYHESFLDFTSDKDKALKQRIIDALKAGGSAALLSSLSHPVALFIVNSHMFDISSGFVSFQLFTVSLAYDFQ
jgi:hypothetical protein